MKNPVSRFLPIVTIAIAALFASGCASTQPTKQPDKAPDTKAVAETKPAASTTKAEPTVWMGSYNVVRGDNLWNISAKPTIYGNPYQWPLIFKANRDKIQDADLIEPGQVLSIEKNPSTNDMNAAVAHARTRGAWSLRSTEASDLSYLKGYNLK